MTYEKFEEKWNELTFEEQLSIYNTFLDEECKAEGHIYEFDEDFFTNSFSTPMQAARATYFGKIESWADEFITLDAYGNLKSLNKYEVKKRMEEDLWYIYDNERFWQNHIEEDEVYDEEDEID